MKLDKKCGNSKVCVILLKIVTDMKCVSEVRVFWVCVMCMMCILLGVQFSRWILYFQIHESRPFAICLMLFGRSNMGSADCEFSCVTKNSLHIISKLEEWAGKAGWHVRASPTYALGPRSCGGLHCGLTLLRREKLQQKSVNIKQKRNWSAGRPLLSYTDGGG